jgi:hypothetical protein
MKHGIFESFAQFVQSKNADTDKNILLERLTTVEEKTKNKFVESFLSVTKYKDIDEASKKINKYCESRFFEELDSYLNARDQGPATGHDSEKNEYEPFSYEKDLMDRVKNVIDSWPDDKTADVYNTIVDIAPSETTAGLTNPMDQKNQIEEYFSTNIWPPSALFRSVFGDEILNDDNN